MPTPTPDPFTPRGAPTREQLEAYAEGRLSAAEAHAVELHLEADPLLREAMEGLRMPGSVAALDRLARHRPPAGIPWKRIGLVSSAVIVAVVLLIWSIPVEEDAAFGEKPANDTGAVVVKDDAITLSDTPIRSEEISSAMEIPVAEQIGHAPTDRHAFETSQRNEIDRVSIDRLDTRGTDVERTVATNKADPARASRPSLQLLYLYDLKLVDPTELYSKEPILTTEPEHVPARFADGQQQRANDAQQITMPYTAFMDAALEKFARNDHKGCLEDLRFLMRQYPDDVNALFYAGLCCYNLGLNTRALDLLQRAAAHAVPVFDEEAGWYHALTLERSGRAEEARNEFQRISAAEGFYAAQARARLGQ
jgi:tetratricopeptide (TPR) repeat protein